MDTVVVTSDSPLSPHQTTPPLQSDARVLARTSVQISYPPNIILLNFCTDLVVSPLSYHMNFVPQPPSSYSYDPSDDDVLCSSIPDSTLVVNEDQAINEVSVSQPTCIVIHQEYDQELDHRHLAKDDSLMFEPPPFFPDIFSEPAIHDFTCVSLSMHAPIIDNS